MASCCIPHRRPRGVRREAPPALLSGGTEAWTATSNYNNMHFGYSSDALRMNIGIQSTATHESLLHVYFPYSSLSRVVAIPGRPARACKRSRRSAGRARLPPPQCCFHAKLAPGEQITVYARAESMGSIGVTSQLWSPAAFASHNVGSTATVALYCGLMLGLGIYHLLLGGLLRNRNYLLYGNHLLLFMLAAANACGLLLLRNLYAGKRFPAPGARCSVGWH